VLDETNRIANNTHPIDTRPIDTRPIDTRSIDTRPIDTRPIDTRSIDTRSIDTRSIDTRSIDSRPVDARSSDAARERIGFRTTRAFFVSPFLHGPRVYEWWFPTRRDPDRLAITMHVDTPDGDRIFTATMAGERRALTDRALLGAAARYPLNTAQVIGLIHFEALKLRFFHDQPYRRPGPDHRPLDL
jgi:hypothetical protein